MKVGLTGLKPLMRVEKRKKKFIDDPSQTLPLFYSYPPSDSRTLAHCDLSSSYRFGTVVGRQNRTPTDFGEFSQYFEEDGLEGKMMAIVQVSV
jgi:hypothetical protein